MAGAQLTSLQESTQGCAVNLSPIPTHPPVYQGMSWYEC